MAKPRPFQCVARRFEETVIRHALLKKGDRVLVAFSGGQDSTALLGLLLEIRKKWSLDIVLAHFNHHLRRAAAGDVAFAKKTARELGLRLFLGEADVRAHARRRGLNLEEAARILRYDFLKRTAAQARADKIATGHTLTDQAETFLMRLLRGSGPAGLAGIFPCLDGLVIRPVLGLERQELEAYLRDKRLAFRQDESNFDLRYARNRIRLKLIPLLRKGYDPAIVKHLGQAASILQDENGLLEDLAAHVARRVLRRGPSGPTIDRAALIRMPAALRRRVIRIFLRELKGDLRDVSFDDVEALAGLGPGKELVLSPKLILKREGGLIVPGKAKAQRPPNYDFLWDGRGTLKIPQAGLALRGRFLRAPRLDTLRFEDEQRAYVDASPLAFPLRVRSRRAGDRYRPLGAPGKKKLKEILRARGLPLGERDRRPVILSGDRILWMPGLRVAEEFKVGRRTSRVLMIEKRDV